MAESDPLNLAPHSLEAEENTLGSIIIDPRLLATVKAFLTPDDFFIVRHGWIYAVMLAVYEESKTVDTRLLAEKLRGRNQLDDIGGEAYLEYLPTTVISASNGEIYAHLVERAAYRRRLLGFAGDAARLAHAEDRDVMEVTAEIESRWHAVKHGLQSGGIRSMADIARARWDEILDGNDRYIPTGFADLDEQLSGGLQPQNLYVLAGRPGMGKTTLALTMARNITFRTKLPVLIVSYEMTEGQLNDWLVAGQMKYPASDFWKIKHDQDRTAASRYMDANAWVATLPIYVNDESNTTPAQIAIYTRQLQQQYGRVGAIIVDHLNRAPTGIRQLDYSDNGYARVSLLAKEYKNLAKDTDTPVVSIVQLSRAVEQRQDKRPMLSDLRESGRIEEEADVALGLYRASYYDHTLTDEVERMTTEVIAMKNRQGSPGRVYLQSKFSHSRFYNSQWQGENVVGINWSLEKRLDGDT